MKTIGNKAKLLAELAGMYDDQIHADEITVHEFQSEIRRTGGTISNRAAYARLNRMCIDGKLTKRIILLNGAQTCVFRKA